MTATPTPESSPAPTVLGYVTEQTYRPSSRISVIGVILVLLGGLAAAAIGALVAFIWIVSGLPNYLFLPLVLQGVVVGFSLSRLFRRFRFRSAPAAIVIGVACAVASAAMFYGALYVRNTWHVRDQILAQLAQSGVTVATPNGLRTIQRVKDHPFDVFDRAVIYPQTGIHGFLGYLRLRQSEISFFALVQIVMVGALAVGLSKASANRPFCATCNRWFKDPFNVAVLPAGYAEALAQAILSDDPRQVIALHHQSFGQSLDSSCAVARVYACAGCETRLVEVILKGAQSSSAQRLAPGRVTHEMIEALKYEPVPQQTATAPANASPIDS